MAVMIRRGQEYEQYQWVDGALVRLEDLREIPELSDEEKRMLVEIADKLWQESSKKMREEILLLTLRP